MTELRPHGAETGFSWPHPLPVCWVLGDGTPGMEFQSVGLVETMGLKPVIKRVKLKRLWRVLTPHVMAFKRYAISDAGDQLEPPWPDITIGTGRPSILPAMYVKGQSGGRTFAVQIQDPVRLRHRYDRIVVPAHDCVTGPNIITMDGSLHIITPERLRSEAPRWEPRFAHLPSPRLAVLIGGRNSRYDMGPGEIAALGAQLKALAAQGWGLLITGSRRTGAANMEALRKALEGVPAFIFDGAGDNPYFGMLALADAFIVTYDSINLATEACSTGKPVHVFSLPKRRGGTSRDKFFLFHAGMQKTGRTRPFNGRIESWSYEPMREMERVARIVRDAYLASR
jgi:uncharacterized protein